MISIPVVTIVFLVGVALLFMGILGGGVEVRGITIPKLPIVPRLGTIAAGAILVVPGILLVGEASLNSPSNASSPASVSSTQADQPAPPSASTATPIPATPREVQFQIHDQLGNQEVEEQVTVLIDGKRVGTLNVSPDFQDQVLKLNASQGMHSYTVSARARFVDGYIYTGVGQGTIDVVSGRTYEVAGDISGSTWLVTLIEA